MDIPQGSQGPLWLGDTRSAGKFRLECVCRRATGCVCCAWVGAVNRSITIKFIKDFALNHQQTYQFLLWRPWHTSVHGRIHQHLFILWSEIRVQCQISIYQVIYISADCFHQLCLNFSNFDVPLVKLLHFHQSDFQAPGAWSAPEPRPFPSWGGRWWNMGAVGAPSQGFSQRSHHVFPS